MLPEEKRNDGMQDHAIIVGYGRVGRIVSDELKPRACPLWVVEENRRRVE
jgi:monovalent cation:H+ antiporter-2, CPA2 family